MRRHFLYCSTAGALLWIVSPSTLAQTSTVFGTVRTHGDSARLLRDVEIAIDPLGRVTRTDSLGAFRFSGIASGDYRLHFRRVGFEPTLVKVIAIANREVGVQVSMKPLIQAMATITIAGQRVTYPARYSDAYMRASRGAGHFFTREQIDSLFPLDVQSLLLRLPGVHINGQNIEFVRCRLEGHIQVWVDGTRWTNYSTRRSEFDVNAAMAIRDIVPSTIQIMEVYSGPSSIPGEFLDDACGVIVIWRK